MPSSPFPPVTLEAVDYFEEDRGWRPLQAHPQRLTTSTDGRSLVVELGMTPAAFLLTKFRLRTASGRAFALERRYREVSPRSVTVCLSPSRPTLRRTKA